MLADPLPLTVAKEAEVSRAEVVPEAPNCADGRAEPFPKLDLFELAVLIVTLPLPYSPLPPEAELKPTCEAELIPPLGLR